jgi:hypothetical protein
MPHTEGGTEPYSDWDSESSITPDTEDEPVPQKLQEPSGADRMMKAEEILPDIPGLRGLGIEVRVPKVVNASSKASLAKEIYHRALNRGVEMSYAERLAFVRKARDEGIVADLVKDGEIPASFVESLDEAWDEMPIMQQGRAACDAKTLRKMFLGEWSASDQASLDELVEAAQRRMSSLNLSLQLPGVVSTLPAAVGTPPPPPPPPFPSLKPCVRRGSLPPEQH